MAKKEVSPSFQLLSSVAVSGTTVLTSSVSTILYRDSFSYQFNWTGALTGDFEIQGSNDYNQGHPQSGGTLNAGNWASVPFQNTSGTIVTSVSVSSGSAQPILINLADLGFSSLRAVFTNSTSTGTLSAWVAGKSFG